MRGRANTISEEKGEHYLAKAAQDAYHMTVVPMTRRKCAAEVNHIRELVGKLNLGSQDLLGSHELFAHAPLRTGKLQNGTDLRSFRSKIFWNEPVPNYTSIRNVLAPAGAKISSAGLVWTGSVPKEMSI